uniref:Uncharacterized protein n=1 Tax=Lepeophtheirus salmonis TaxID=72036 RepID=A0A0K2T2A7_LEPSM
MLGIDLIPVGLQVHISHLHRRFQDQPASLGPGEFFRRQRCLSVRWAPLTLKKLISSS